MIPLLILIGFICLLCTGSYAFGYWEEKRRWERDNDPETVDERIVRLEAENAALRADLRDHCEYC